MLVSLKQGVVEHRAACLLLKFLHDLLRRKNGLSLFAGDLDRVLVKIVLFPLAYLEGYEDAPLLPLLRIRPLVFDVLIKYLGVEIAVLLVIGQEPGLILLPYVLFEFAFLE